MTGDFDGAMAAAQEAFDLAAVLSDRALQRQAAHRLGQACNASGAHGRGAELLRWSVEAADREAGTSSIASRIDARALLVLTLSDLGAFTEGRRYGEDALRLATREGFVRAPANIRSRLGRLYLAQGDLASAIRVLEQGVALCRASGDWDLLRPTVASLGYACALHGRLAEARALLEEGIREGIRRGEVGNHARWVAWRDAMRMPGSTHARRSTWPGSSRHAGTRPSPCTRWAPSTHATPPDVARAESYYQQALALADELGMRPLRPTATTASARCMRDRPEEQARAALASAIELYRAMEMAFWLPQTETALAQVL